MSNRIWLLIFCMTPAYMVWLLMKFISNLTFLIFTFVYLVCFCKLGLLVFATLLLDTCSCDSKAQVKTKTLNGNIHTYTVVVVCGRFLMDDFCSFCTEKVSRWVNIIPWNSFHSNWFYIQWLMLFCYYLFFVFVNDFLWQNWV